MRKLASIRKIDDIRPIENADAIECVVVGGWTVVAKKGEFQVGELAVYFEIDSWIPTELAPFLSKGKEPREFNGVKGERLRTVKLRGQLSQGLLLPITVMNPRMSELEDHLQNAEGFDCTEWLNIQKWEAPIPAQLAGLVRGNFPSLVPKTDQERIQNLTRQISDWKDRSLSFEVTEKLDGSSCTMFLDLEGEFHVCSRNLDLKRNEDNTFWKVALAQRVEEQMREHGLLGFALQGELIGEGVQGNSYNIKGHAFYLFDVFNANGGDEHGYVGSIERVRIAKLLGVNHVPVLQESWEFAEDTTVADLLLNAEGKSQLNSKTEREGLVFKCNEDPSLSFKAISNKFLLKCGDR